MTTRSIRCIAFVSVTLAAPALLRSQAPLMPPAMMVVGCEYIKPGMGPAHDRNEVRWARAGEAVKGVAGTLALQSATGTQATCWLTAVANYDQIEKNNALYATDPAYSKAIPSLVSADAPFLNDTRTSIAVLRPDLSAGEMPNALTKRVTAWSEWRVRFGTEAAFIAALKAYRAAATRAGANPSFRVYEVVQGAAATTFWLFSSDVNMAGFDVGMANDPKIAAAYTPADLKIFDEASTKSIVNTVSNIWTYNSAQSTLSAAQRDTDPFWKRKIEPKMP